MKLTEACLRIHVPVNGAMAYRRFDTKALSDGAFKLTTIGSDNGLWPGRRQAIICTNAGILSIGPLGTNLSEILIEIWAFLYKQMHLKVSPA